MMVRAVTTELLTYLEQDGETFTGLFSPIWEGLKRRLNFSVVSIGVIDTGELYSDKNGSGIMGNLIRNESDFTFAPILLSKETDVIWLDYTSRIGYVENVLISGPPRKFQTDFFSSLSCFQPSLWIVLFLVLFSYSLFWVFVNWLIQPLHSSVEYLKEFANNLFSSAMMLVNQFRLVSSDRLHERLSWISWRIAAMCLSLAFTGILLAKLAKKDAPFRYETLKDVYEDKNMKLFVMENSAAYYDMKASPDLMKRDLWARIQKDGSASNFKDINVVDLLSEMAQSKLVTLYSLKGFLITMTYMCDPETNFYVSKQTYKTMNFVLFMRKDLDPNIKRIIKDVAALVEPTYIVQSKIETIKALGRLCIDSQPDEFPDVPLTIEMFHFIFIFYGICCSLAICSFFAEILMSIMKTCN